MWRNSMRTCETLAGFREGMREAYQVKMYCVWLFLKFTVGARPMGTPLGSRS